MAGAQFNIHYSIFIFITLLGMFKTRKNNLTMEEGHKLKNMIASLSGPQQMTVIEILRENKESLPQDEEGNVEMEFREFHQKSIDDLKSYVFSVMSKPTSAPVPAPNHTGGGTGGKDLSGSRNTTNQDSEEDSDSDDSSSSDSDSDEDSD